MDLEGKLVDLKEVALRNINVEGLGHDFLDEILEASINEVVADTANPIDDMVAAALYPPLEAVMKKKISEFAAKLYQTKEEEVVK